MIELRNSEEIKALAESGRVVGEVLKRIKEFVRPGITTKDIDDLAMKCVKETGARPAFLGYRGYPAAVCVSVNSEVIHGIPSRKRVIKDGDIVSVDFGAELNGFYGDAAISVAAGTASKTAQKLMRITEEALYRGIEMAVPGNRLSDISSAIQRHVEENGFSVVRDFVGHGIGKKLHEDPPVPNFGKPGQGPLLEKGMVLAIEPMVNEKGWQVVMLDDEWTVVTADSGLSAHYEHTIAVTEKAPLILTLPQ